MSIGTGIAILGIWLFPSLCAISKTVTGYGFLISVAVASILTFLIV